MKHQDDEALGNAFDITWLTIVCIKLKEIKAGKKTRMRRSRANKAVRLDTSEGWGILPGRRDRHSGTGLGSNGIKRLR